VTEDKPRGFIRCIDMAGKRLYACSVQGQRAVYRLRGKHRLGVSDGEIMRRFYPGYDPSSAREKAGFKTIDRNL
jgi:hypothetical protein